MDNVEPLSIEQMEIHYNQLNRGGTANNTLCCVLADIYFNSSDERVKLQCRRAATMAKKMSKKLEQYKRNQSCH